MRSKGFRIVDSLFRSGFRVALGFLIVVNTLSEGQLFRPPKLVGTYRSTNYVDDLCVVGNLVYTVDGTQGYHKSVMEIVDVSNPTAPKRKSATIMDGNAGKMYVQGNLAFIVGTLYKVFDVSNPNAPLEISPPPVPPNIVSYGQVFFDVTHASNPNAVATYELAAKLNSTHPLIFSIGVDGMFQVLDVSMPSQPKVLGQCIAMGRSDEAYGFAIKDNIVVAVAYGGLKTIDVSDLSRPVVVGHDAISYGGIAVAVRGNYAFFSATSFGLRILDISDPANPALVYTFPIPTVYGAKIQEDLLYMAGDADGLKIYDISQMFPSAIPPADIPVQVTTVAGSGAQSFLDSSNPLLAQFNWPNGGAVNRDGVIFVADAGNQVIRFILPTGEVGTWAGQPGVAGYREGVGTNVLFNVPIGLALDSVGDLLVADYAGQRVRKVLGVGYRSSALLGGDGTAGLVADFGGKARLNGPNDVVELGGEIYFTEFFNHTVRKIDRFGMVSVVAGNGLAGFKDGSGAQAQFNGPGGICAFNGNLYVTDWNNNRVRKVTTWGAVTTIAGSGTLGLKNGLGTEADLGNPDGIVADSVGNFYFTEHANSAIRRLDTNGWVSTLAGGVKGFADGDRTTAMFASPGGICFHPDGSLIVTDTENNRVRRIVLDGKTNAWTRAGGLLTVDLHPTLKVYGAVGERYRIEARDRLGAGDWAAVETITIERSPMVWVDERGDAAGQRVYRAVKE